MSDQRTVRAGRVVVAAVVAATLAQSALAGPEAAKELKSKDPVVRLAVVERAIRLGGADAEATLLLALGNDDWEVAELAATGLGTRGAKASVARLLEAALEGPVRGVRLAAARSAAKIDADRTLLSLGKAVSGSAALRGYEALAAIGESGPSAGVAALVDKGLDGARGGAERPVGRARDPVRAAAASALGAFGRADRKDRLARLLADPDPSVACAALLASASAPDVAVLDALLGAPAASAGRDCVERRLRTAVRAAVAGRPRGSDAALAAAPVFAALAAAPTPAEARRLVAVAGALAEPAEAAGADVPDEPLVAAVVAALSATSRHADASVRSAVAAAFGRIRAPAAVPALAALAASDADAHVRLVAVPALAASAPRDPAAVAALVKCLDDADAAVRESAAAALGIEGAREVVPALTKAAAEALADPAKSNWALASAALVSLGATRESAAVEPLATVLRTAADWRVRASAVEGLARVRQTSAIPLLADALDDTSPTVKATALAALIALGGRDVGSDAKSWRAWWKTASAGFFFPDHRAALRESQMYGWSETDSGVYEDLDVVVLTGSAADDAHRMLDLLKIRYRTVKPGQLAATGLHPGALVLGFADDPSPADAEVLEWHLRAGGILAAGGERLERVLVRGSAPVFRVGAAEGAAAAAGLVPVAPCTPWSAATDGVFGGAVPMRRAEPRAFVTILDPDRVEVAIDSPHAAAAFGAADVACFLRAGHGTALELGGGLDAWGEEWFEGARTPDARAAVAVERMGLTYDQVRKLRERKVFDSAAKCAAEVVDLSSFRFVTNFVRAKRRAE